VSPSTRFQEGRHRDVRSAGQAFIVSRMTIFAPRALALVILGLLVACSTPENAAPDASSSSRILDAENARPTEAEIAAVSDVAAPVAGALTQTLGSNLTAAIADGGHVGAMEFCNVEAMPLTQQVMEEQGMEVKRTSWRVRNPSNAPDALETEALAHFASAAEAGTQSTPWVQVDPSGGWRYYQPLPAGELCLSCHGGADQLAEGVQDALDRLYPQDEAVGFSAGELRGLLRISVPADALSEGGG